MSMLKLYHGSLDQSGIQTVRRDIADDPHCQARNGMDFGKGFYLTPRENQAREWSVRDGKDGSLSSFLLHIDGLRIINLDPLATPPLCWLAEIIANRVFTGISSSVSSYIQKNWKIHYQNIDVIMGYTADDQYNSIVLDFVKNQLSYEGLCKALLLGNLGYQYVLRTNKAYDCLEKIGKNKRVFASNTYSFAQTRHKEANVLYDIIKSEHNDITSDEIFFSHIVKKNMRPDDKRLLFAKDAILHDERFDRRAIDEADAFSQSLSFPGEIKEENQDDACTIVSGYSQSM